MQKTRRLKIKDKSTVSKSEYLYDHILFGAILGYDIYKILPLLVPVAYYEQSLSRVIVCMALTSVLGIAFTYNNNRTTRGTFFDALSGMGLYTILTVGTYLPAFMKFILAATFITTVFGLALIFFHKIKKRNRMKQIIVSRFCRSVLLVRRNVGVAAAIALIALPVSLHFTKNDNVINTYNEKAGNDVVQEFDEGSLVVNQIYGDEYGLSKNLDTIRLIRDNDKRDESVYNN